MTDAREQPAIPPWVDASRLFWVVLAFLLVYSTVTIRCVYLQLISPQEILARGAWKADSWRDIAAARGAITDRNGVPLAQSVETATLAVDPRVFFSRTPALLPELVRILSQQTDVDVAQFTDWASRPAATLPQYRVLARHMNPARAQELVRELHAAGIERGVWSEPSFRRVYGQGDLAATTVGLTAQDGSHGLSGLELQWEHALAGETVRVAVTRDYRRRAFQLEEPHQLEEARGNTVVTTLDARLQQFTQDALGETIDEFDAEAGVVVVSRVATGEILAMATAPNFDPNRAFMDDHVVWQNAGVSWTYEPGSTIKIFTFAAAFDAGLLGYDEPIDCGNGAARVGRFTIRDTHRMGVVPAWTVMQHSSNIGAMRIGRRMDQQTHYDTLARFGFGRRTSLLREDVAGILRPPPWAESEHSTVSYGHGLTVTPLQLNMATAAIANGGILMEPMFVERIENSDGDLVQLMQPREVGRAVSERAAELTGRALMTVTEREGTGRRAVVPGVLVAGKTGTSRLVGAHGYETEYMTSFTGYLPADAPEFAITVMIVRPDQELGYYGGVVAAPLFRRVAEQALLLDGFTLPEDGENAETRATDAPHGDGDADERNPAHEGSTTAPAPLAMDGVTPDLRGLWLTQAMQRIAAAGWQVRVHGSGRVVRQNPPAWAGEPADGVVEIWLQSASREPVESGDDAP